MFLQNHFRTFLKVAREDNGKKESNRMPVFKLVLQVNQFFQAYLSMEIAHLFFLPFWESISRHFVLRRGHGNLIREFVASTQA